ncbi:MAG: alginate export family protein [Candidatus Solibacter sp.]
MTSKGCFSLLGLCLMAAAASAQCIVDNPGGSKTNPNRPADADVPPPTRSPIAKLNDTLPHWLCFTAGYRVRLESSSAGNPLSGNSDTYLLTRLRVGAAIRPATWLRSYFELQDATAFGKTPPLGPPFQSTWDLRRGYVDFGDAAAGGLSLRVGRQDLSFGRSRLLGTSYWRNASRGWDAILAGFDANRVRVNVFSASPVIPGINGLSHHLQGSDMHGVYTVLRPGSSETALEPYFFWRLAPGFQTEAGQPSKINQKTLGMRYAGAYSHFDYDTEIAAQTGKVGTDRIRAWAWSAIGGYTVDPLRRSRVFFGFDYASGDRNAADGVRGTFDHLYQNVHDQRGVADLVGWQNLAAIRSGIRVPVRRNWMVAAAYNDWWLAQATDAFYSGQGAVVAVDHTGRSGTHIGREYDLQTSYRPNRHLELAAGIGHVRAGEFLLRTHHAGAYTYPFLMLYYNVF